MIDNLQKHAEEQKKLKISLAMVLALMVWGLVFNELTTSNIVELDAGSYIISGLIGIVTIYVSRLQSRPSTTSHPLGYSGFVPILNLMRSFMIILICLKAIGESIGSIVSGPPEPEHGIVFLYAGVTLILNGIAYYYIHKSAVETGSQILKVDAIEWEIDIFYNVCIMLSFTVAYALTYFGYTAAANYVDPVFCMLLSIGMSISPIQMFAENIRKLSLRSIDEPVQKNIIAQFHQQIPHIKAFTPNFNAIDLSGILVVEVQLYLNDKAKWSHDLLEEWETEGKTILGEINPNHHLIFSLR